MAQCRIIPGDCSNFMSIDLSCNFKINFKIKLFVSFMPELHDSAGLKPGDKYYSLETNTQHPATGQLCKTNCKLSDN